MGVGINHPGDAVAEVQQLHPVEDGVAAVIAGGGEGGGRGEDFLQRMDFDNVHEVEHFFETSVRGTVHVAVAEHLDEVGVIGLDDFIAAVVPHGKAFDLDLGIVVGEGTTAVLGAGMVDEWKSVLVVDG